MTNRRGSFFLEQHVCRQVCSLLLLVSVIKLSLASIKPGFISLTAIFVTNPVMKPPDTLGSDFFGK
jgi:hypothetical protein